MRRRGGSLSTMLLATALLATAGSDRAEAGNRSTFLIGGRAAAMAGAFTSLADDGSAAWYNPAGLATHDRHSINLSATAYSVEIFEIPGLVQTSFGAETRAADYETTALSVVPTSLNAVYRLSERQAAVRHVLAISVFVPDQYDLAQTFEVDEALGGGVFRQKITLEDRATRYVIGPSYGVGFGHLRLGASLFGVYDSGRSEAQLYFHQDAGGLEAPRDTYVFIRERLDAQVFGLVLALAVQADVGGLRLGLQLRSPVLRVYESVDGADLLAVSLPDEGTSELVDDDIGRSGWGFDTASPWSVTAGLGYEEPGSWRVGLDVAWDSAHDDGAAGVDLRHTVNVAVGAEVYLTKRLPLAFGFFTDFHPQRSLDEFGDVQIDYYGATLGLSFVTPYDVKDSERTDRITFDTTIGLHYAYGSGDAMGALFDYAVQQDIILRKRPLEAHDVSAFVASSIRL